MEHIPGQSKIHEVMLLGEVGPEPEESVSKRWSRFKLPVALHDTKAMQPAVLERSQFNPEGVAHSSVDPAPDFANQLHAELMERLGLFGDKDDYDRLKYFIGVHGPADSVGVDCWFEYIRDDGKKIFAFIDHTEDPDKRESKYEHVDYILFVDPVRDMDNGEGFKKLVKKTADAITKILETKEPNEELQNE